MANERKKLPALDNAAKVKKPDLPDIADKNYTDKILKYGGLATRFPQLNTNAKTVVAAINELQAGGSGDGKHRTLTQAEYDELTPEEKMDGTIYFIIDAEGPSGGVTKLNELEDVMPPTTNDNGALLAWSTSNEMWECVVPDSAENGYILVWNEDDGQWTISPIHPDYIRSDKDFPINGNIVFSTENGNYVESEFPTLNPGAIMFWNYESQMWDISNFDDLQQGDTIVWNGESSWINVPAGGTPIIEQLESEDVYSPADGTIIQYNYSNSQWVVNTAIENVNHGQVLTWDANYGMWRNRITFDDEYTDTGYVFAYDYDSEKWVSRRLNLYELGDCLFDSTSPQEGDVLTYTLYNGDYIWMPQPASGGGASELEDLDDVDISSPTTNQVLTYQDGYWVNANASGGASALDDLTDVDISSAQSGQVLKYNGYEWVNANESTGSTVSVTQIQSTGTKIATITVDSVGTDLYAPNDGATDLDDLSDVTISSAITGQILKYNNGTWENANESTGSTVSVTQIQSTGTKIATITVDSVGTDLYAPNGGGGATALDDLTDVDIDTTTLANRDELVYNSSTSQWENKQVTVTLTQAQYDALVIAGTVDPDIFYLITDASIVPWTDLTDILTAGSTSITFSNAIITTNSTIDVYTDSDIDYNSITVTTGQVVITFDAQANNVSVKVRVS